MEAFVDEDPASLAKLEELYVHARALGAEWVSFLDLCMDGGDSVQEMHDLFWEAVKDFETV